MYFKCPDNTLIDGFNNKCVMLSNFYDFYNGISNYIKSINLPY